MKILYKMSILAFSGSFLIGIPITMVSNNTFLALIFAWSFEIPTLILGLKWSKMEKKGLLG